jgi:hypothetical protein
VKWTSDYDEALKRLHGRGISYSIIAFEMGLTKNQCIGRAERLGLPRRGKITVPIRSMFPPVKRGTCRYPLWGAKDRISHQYCGEKISEGSYCRTHRRICYQWVPLKIVKSDGAD